MEQNLDESERKLISDTLETVLKSERFEAAPQMSAFLRYVVEQAVSGNHTRIKAFTVAVDALGKPDTFDPQNDPLVRVLAGRLRAALTGYREEHPESALFITMNPGSYVPIFLKSKANEQTTSDSPTDATPTDSATPASVADEPAIQGIKSDDTEAETCHADLMAEASASENLHYAQSPDNRAAKNGDGLLSASAPRTYRLQQTAIASIFALALSLVYFGYQRTAQIESENPGTASVNSSSPDQLPEQTVRARPDEPVIFISAADHINPLEMSLNAVVSSVVSEGEYLKVFRYFNSEHIAHFWPEDYMLNLSAVDLPDETRIDMQLVEAQSGKLVHSQVMSFSSMAAEQLTREEMDALIEATRSIVDKNGPLLADYSSRTISR